MSKVVLKTIYLTSPVVFEALVAFSILVGLRILVIV